jgi:hypothetical protein
MRRGFRKCGECKGEFPPSDASNLIALRAAAETLRTPAGSNYSRMVPKASEKGAALIGVTMQYRAAREILLRRPPRLRSGSFTKGKDETAAQFAPRVISNLEDIVLPVQGPREPGKLTLARE